MKIKIFILKSLDWALFIAVISLGIYALFYAENRVLPAIAALAGLYLVQMLGSYTMSKANALRLERDIQKRMQSNK